jgi:transposase InsO family protein
VVFGPLSFDPRIVRDCLRTLARHKMSRLPCNHGRRAVHTHRYAKTERGHHIQADAKILSLKTQDGQRVRRFQYTAIDDETRVRALKIYTRQNQQNAIKFADYFIEKYPFRIQTIRTDRGHEFQAQFHWHVEDRGIRHVNIKPRTPQLNGKVERSHRSDQEESYQLLTYKSDVDLNKKPEARENFYNFNRLHGTFEGKTPYEVLRSLLHSCENSPIAYDISQIRPFRMKMTLEPMRFCSQLESESRKMERGLPELRVTQHRLWSAGSITGTSIRFSIGNPLLVHSASADARSGFSSR